MPNPFQVAAAAPQLPPQQDASGGSQVPLPRPIPGRGGSPRTLLEMLLGINTANAAERPMDNVIRGPWGNLPQGGGGGFRPPVSSEPPARFPRTEAAQKRPGDPSEASNEAAARGRAFQMQGRQSPVKETLGPEGRRAPSTQAEQEAQFAGQAARARIEQRHGVAKEMLKAQRAKGPLRVVDPKTQDLHLQDPVIDHRGFLKEHFRRDKRFTGSITTDPLDGSVTVNVKPELFIRNREATLNFPSREAAVDWLATKPGFSDALGKQLDQMTGQ